MTEKALDYVKNRLKTDAMEEEPKFAWLIGGWMLAGDLRKGWVSLSCRAKRGPDGLFNRYWDAWYLPWYKHPE